MAVIIRLLGLPVSAGSADVRQFFTGLNIPDGGVHIFGGKLGEAFVTFATDEDARRAMSRSGGNIRESTIQLYLSSKTQMQNTIERNRKRKGHGEREPVPGTKRHRFRVPSASEDEKVSDSIESDKGINKTDASPSDFYSYRRTAAYDSDDRYLFVRGMPYLATVEDIKAFFHGLHVVGVLFLLHRTGPKIGLRSGKCMVKFASSKDAIEGRKLDKHFFMGVRFIQITRATKNQWDRFNALTLEQNYVHSKKIRSKSPRKERSRSCSPQNPAFYIHMKNLPYNIEKRNIRFFFRNIDLSDEQIKFLQYSYNNRRTDGFVMLKSERDYRIALSFHKCALKNRRVYIYPISRKSMLELLEKVESAERASSVEYMPDSSYQATASKPRLYLYVKNFPFDVTKAEVQKFFVGFSLNDDDIYMLYDEQGVGLGEAIVILRSEELATHAEILNRQRFLGTEVLLQRISEAQVKKFDINAFPRESSNKIQDKLPLYDMDHSHSDSSRASSVQSFEVPPLRHSSEKSRHLHSHVAFSSRFDMRSSGSEGNPEGRLSVDDKSSAPVVIQLKNMPLTTTVNEIMDFFYGFRVIPNSVSIQHESGFPTGIATVAMESTEEAIAAVRELHGRPVGPHRVQLSLA